MWNGDYAAYLIHTTEDLSTSATAVLLNRVGRSELLPSGYDDNGFDITLRDDGLSNVHTYRFDLGGFQLVTDTEELFRLIGVGQPDGRLVDPSVVVTSDPVTHQLTPLGLLDPNGKWQFKIGDMEAGFQGRLDSWSVTMTPVIPEPSTWALLVLGAGTLACALLKRR